MDCFRVTEATTHYNSSFPYLHELYAYKIVKNKCLKTAYTKNMTLHTLLKLAM